jgi:hypothetical protein
MLLYGKRSKQKNEGLSKPNSGESTPPVNANQEPPRQQFVQSDASIAIDVQTDFPNRTCGIATEIPQVRTIDTLTDSKGFFDRFVETDKVGYWDVSVQNRVDMCDVAVDVGEWNHKVVCSLDAQTDAPDLNDSLFWCTTTPLAMIPFIASILDRVDEDFLGTKEPTELISKDKRENIQLRADNIMLRVEIADLKRRLKQPGPHSSPVDPLSENIPHRCSPYKASLAGLHGGLPASTRYVVTSDDGAIVTSSLAPSSYALGHLSSGDSVLSAGTPESILDQVRIPVLPRGWITIRDSNQIYMKPAQQLST